MRARLSRACGHRFFDFCEMGDQPKAVSRFKKKKKVKHTAHHGDSGIETKFTMYRYYSVSPQTQSKVIRISPRAIVIGNLKINWFVSLCLFFYLFETIKGNSDRLARDAA